MELINVNVNESAGFEQSWKEDYHILHMFFYE